MIARLVAAVLLLLVGLPLPRAHAAEAREARLANGMTVLVRENPVTPVVAVSLMVKMGGRWERAENAGISNFLQAVIVKGTKRRSGAQLADTIASLGGKLSAEGEVDESEIRGTALARFWRQLLGLTAELALEPTLAKDDVDRERDWLLSRVQRRHDNAFSRAFDQFYATLYGPHPYASPVLGTPASLARIDQAAVVDWYRTFYRPERMVLAVSGQVTAADVLREAERLFGALPRGARAPDESVPPPPRAAHRVLLEQPAQQAQILVGALAPPLDDPDRSAVKVLATVLGGGMASRLFVELRDRTGLAYTARAYYEPTHGPGALVLYLGTAPGNVARAEEGLLREIARIRSEPVSAEELARAKAYLLGSYVMDRRTNERRAWYLAFYEIQSVGMDFPERYRRAVQDVSAADVLRVARRYLDPLTTVVLRPAVTPPSGPVPPRRP